MPLNSNSVSGTDLLNHFQRIEKTKENVWKQKRPYVSASMCQRQIMLNGVLPTREVSRTPAMKYYAAIGNALESVIVENYRSAGSLVIDSWKLPKSLFPEGIDLGAKLDMIIDFQSTPILIDIKTIGVVDNSAYVNLTPAEVQELEKGNDIVIVPDDERIKYTASKKIKEAYVSQLQLYAAITGLDNIFLMNVSRRIQDTFTVDGHVSAQFSQISILESALQRRVAILLYGIMARDLGKEPAPLSTLKKSHCNDAFCGFVNHCYNGEELSQTFDALTPEEEKDLKTQAQEIAKIYIANRQERAQLTLELIKEELDRRHTIQEKLDSIQHTHLAPVLEEYNIYPWDGSVTVRW